VSPQGWEKGCQRETEEKEKEKNKQRRKREGMMGGSGGENIKCNYSKLGPERGK